MGFFGVEPVGVLLERRVIQIVEALVEPLDGDRLLDPLQQLDELRCVFANGGAAHIAKETV